MRYLKVLALIILFVVSILFFSQNNQILAQSLVLKLDVPYIAELRSVPLPFYFLVLGGFVIGAILTMLYFLCEKLKSAKQLRDCRTRMNSLEQELNSLRNMPLNEEPMSGSSEEGEN
ncbi:LapA family protein [Salidesulfovibrio brasiliensis]|uniref:LapA family protein n=1 Tax=Salidesulfovibrio brasiliensis TaxID=221711 RepID=UPI0006CF92DE|nr:LapA family protein [Salidesulfovibrio brasiliensis]